VFEEGMLRKVFGSEKEAVTRGRRTFSSEECHNFYSS
jgi:hypothetical protein